MYKIKILSHFSAAHSLREYQGKCESLHGHNWKVEILAGSEHLDRLGMVMDFHDLKKVTKDVLSEFDHKHLNEIEYFKTHNPSSEEIARYIFTRLKSALSKFQCVLCEVRVWETESSCAMYSE